MKPKVNKQRMLSHQMNDGKRILDPNGCRCIKGAFLDGLCEIPEVPDTAKLGTVEYRKSDTDPLSWNYHFILGHPRSEGYIPIWRLNFPHLVSVLDRYESKLMYSDVELSQEQRQELLRNCVAELEEHDLVLWEEQTSVDIRANRELVTA